MQARSWIVATTCVSLLTALTVSASADDTTAGVVIIEAQIPQDSSTPAPEARVQVRNAAWKSGATLVADGSASDNSSGASPQAECGPGCPGGCEDTCPTYVYGNSQPCLYTADCNGCGSGNCLTKCWHSQSLQYVARNRGTSWPLAGWLIPTGCGGSGCPHTGKYSIVYAQNPSYFDQRDGMQWSAQGYGTPVTVPLAPVVRHQFNYGWGIPSSRVTPISHRQGYTTTKRLHW